MADTPATYPGVYVQELPTTRNIQGASTSTPAFIGVTESGPFMQPELITSWNAYRSQFGNLAWYALVSWSVYEFFNEGGSACYVIRTEDTAGARSATTAEPMTLNAVTPGTWGNALSVMISNDGAAEPAASSAATTPGFKVSILVDATLIGTSSAPVNATMPNLLLQEFVLKNTLVPQSCDGKQYYVLEQFGGFAAASMANLAGQPSELASKINSNSIFVRVPVNADAKPGSRPANSGPNPLAGGTDPNHDFVAATKLLSNVQNVSLLSVPDITTATDKNGESTQAQQAALINSALLFCAGAGNVFYVIDPPAGLDVDGIVAFKTGQGKTPDGNTVAINSAYGALYYPWVYIYLPVINAVVPMPPSGPVLGRYAHTDNSVGVFKPPAGIEDGALQSVAMLEQQVSDADQDKMNPQGVNAIRNFINYGNVIYGARTTSMDPDWAYLSVRRLFIYVEQSLKQSLQWVVFEPNNAALWAAVTSDVTAFLHTIWQQGGLFGASASEAYFVTCDESNNPPDTRMQGLLYIDIGMAPVYPAEFMIIRITQQTAMPA